MFGYSTSKKQSSCGAFNKLKGVNVVGASGRSEGCSVIVSHVFKQALVRRRTRCTCGIVRYFASTSVVDSRSLCLFVASVHRAIPGPQLTVTVQRLCLQSRIVPRAMELDARHTRLICTAQCSVLRAERWARGGVAPAAEVAHRSGHAARRRPPLGLIGHVQPDSDTQKISSRLGMASMLAVVMTAISNGRSQVIIYQIGLPLTTNAIKFLRWLSFPPDCEFSAVLHHCMAPAKQHSRTAGLPWSLLLASPGDLVQSPVTRLGGTCTWHVANALVFPIWRIMPFVRHRTAWLMSITITLAQWRMS